MDPGKQKAERLYFAYGSNMCLQRLRARTPSAKPVGTGCLHQHDLRFHKESVDGSAKCDAYYTGSEKHSVHGALFVLSDEDKLLLDDYEGLGKGYERKEVLVECGQDQVQAYIYSATRINAGLKPYDWYKRLVLRGALQHELPKCYIDRIQRIESIPDPDPARHALNMALLSSVREFPDD